MEAAKSWSPRRSSKLLAMLSLSRNRLFLGGITAFLLVLGVWAFKASRPVQIGDFVVPSLPGWKQTRQKSNFTDTVRYEKDDGNNGYAIYFKVRLNSATNPPQTAQDLAAKIVQDSTRMVSAMATVGMQYQTGPPLQRTLNGMPAVETQNLITSSSSVIYGRDITFVNGSQQYDVNVAVSVPAGSPPTPPADVVAQRDQALDAVTQQLVPPA